MLEDSFTFNPNRIECNNVDIEQYLKQINNNYPFDEFIKSFLSGQRADVVASFPAGQMVEIVADGIESRHPRGVHAEANAIAPTLPACQQLLHGEGIEVAVADGESSWNLNANKSTEGKSKEEGKTKKKSDENLLNNKRRKPHDIFDKDNIKRTTQIFYLNFLVDFINLIIIILFDIDFKNKETKDKYQFKQLKNDLKKHITNKMFNELKSKNLKEIFIMNTSDKIKYYKNDTIYENVMKINNKIEKILEEKYLTFFPIFYRKYNFFNLNKYGINIDIPLDNIKRFEYFKTKALKKITEPENQDKYIKRLEESIRANFMQNSTIFEVKK